MTKYTFMFVSRFVCCSSATCRLLPRCAEAVLYRDVAWAAGRGASKMCTAFFRSSYMHILSTQRQRNFSPSLHFSQIFPAMCSFKRHGLDQRPLVQAAARRPQARAPASRLQQGVRACSFAATVREARLPGSGDWWQFDCNLVPLLLVE